MLRERVGRLGDGDEEVSLRGAFSHRFIMRLTAQGGAKGAPPVVKERRGIGRAKAR